MLLLYCCWCSTIEVVQFQMSHLCYSTLSSKNKWFTFHTARKAQGWGQMHLCYSSKSNINKLKKQTDRWRIAKPNSIETTTYAQTPIRPPVGSMFLLHNIITLQVLLIFCCTITITRKGYPVRPYGEGSVIRLVPYWLPLQTLGNC